MTFLRMGAEVLVPNSCVYPGARLRVRSPARLPEGNYIAALGGAATFGKGVARAWPQLLEGATGCAVANLGAVGAGPEAYERDAALLAICASARAVVVEVPGAEALCNPFYRVHSRRNDRVIEVLAPLTALYPELDLHEPGFARGLLARLRSCDAARFAEVASALQAAWSLRMGALVQRISASAPVTLLWLGDRPPPDGTVPPTERSAPALVTGAMLARLVSQGGRVVLAVAEGPQRAAAFGLPSQATHEAAATALARSLATAGSTGAPPDRRAAG